MDLIPLAESSDMNSATTEKKTEKEKEKEKEKKRKEKEKENAKHVIDSLIFREKRKCNVKIHTERVPGFAGFLKEY